MNYKANDVFVDSRINNNSQNNRISRVLVEDSIFTHLLRDAHKPQFVYLMQCTRIIKLKHTHTHTHTNTHLILLLIERA